MITTQLCTIQLTEVSTPRLTFFLDHWNIIDILLFQTPNIEGLQINAKNHKNQTALHVACAKGYFKCAQKLL